MLARSNRLFSKPEPELYLITDEIPRALLHLLEDVILPEELLPKPEVCPEDPPLRRRMLRAARSRPEILAWIA